MLSPRGQLLSRLPARPSFAGRGLFERVRSTAFALLGLTAAMALGLVALMVHQSWPEFPVVPIPDYEAKTGELDMAVALAAPGRAGVLLSVAGSRPRPGAGNGPVDAGLTELRQASTA